MKKVLFLGAATFQVPPIRYALTKGYYVITCDNRPENPGHKLAHRTYNISTVDMEAVLEIASAEDVDGILTCGSDVSAPTVAYVAEQMNLPGNPYRAVVALTNKSLFRDLLKKMGLANVNYRTFSLLDRPAIATYLKTTQLPVVIKPVDGAGSKGVSILNDASRCEKALDYAFGESRSKEIIIEPYVERIGKQICGDGYMEGGRIVFIEFGDGHFYDDCEFLAPFGETFPSTHKREHLEALQSKIETVLIACGFRRGPFNVDALITKDLEPFIIEIGPRNGGNFIPTAIGLHRNVDLIEATVESALSWSFTLNTRKKKSDKFYACYMIHSRSAGILDGIKFHRAIRNHIVQYNPYLAKGSEVRPFWKASDAIGNLVLCYDSMDDMLSKMTNPHQYCRLALR